MYSNSEEQLEERTARGYTSRSQVHQQALQPLPTHSSGSSLFSVSSSPGPAWQDPAQMRQRILLRYSWLGWSFGRGSWPGQTRCPCPALCLPTVAPSRALAALAAPAAWGAWPCLPRCHPAPSSAPRWPGHSCCSHMRASSCEKQTHWILSSHLFSLAYWRKDSTSKVSLLRCTSKVFPS